VTLHNLAYPAVTEQDFDALADLRAAAMQASLQRLGRYDPQRSREPLLFAPRLRASRRKRMGYRVPARLPAGAAGLIRCAAA